MFDKLYSCALASILGVAVGLTIIEFIKPFLH